MEMAVWEWRRGERIEYGVQGRRVRLDVGVNEMVSESEIGVDSFRKIEGTDRWSQVDVRRCFR